MRKGRRGRKGKEGRREGGRREERGRRTYNKQLGVVFCGSLGLGSSLWVELLVAELFHHPL
jgi:hypothetical protein